MSELSQGADVHVPSAALERLRRSRTAGGGFDSTLGTAGFLLARDAGLRPLAQIFGSCVYHVGYQRKPYVRPYAAASYALGRRGRFAPGPYRLIGTPAADDLAADFDPSGAVYQELGVLTEAWNTARRRALSRLAEEAAAAGADAVVDLRVQRREYDWVSEAIEYVVTGTAVAAEEFEIEGEPTLANISLPDFGTLLRAGWWPVGLVATSLFAYVVASFQDEALTGNSIYWRFQTRELDSYTNGLYETRERAMRQLRREAQAVGAAGVLGLGFEHEQHVRERNERHDLIVAAHLIGTGVVPVEQDEPPPQVYYAVSVNETRRQKR